MALARLIVSAVRNVRHADIVLAPGLNMLVGANGSGKSSVLEAIHLLSQGRSFRSGNVRGLISYGEKSAAVSGQLCAASVSARQIDITLAGGDRRRRVDGRVSDRQAELAALLPVVLLQPSSQILLESSPELRRQYMDWGAFQAIGDKFLSCWRRYGKCLDQRNALLRGGGGSGLATWEREMGRYGEELAQFRRDYMLRLAPYLVQAVDRLAIGFGRVDVTYERGWPAEVALSDVLGGSRDKDRRVGYSSVGPHRSDFRVSVEGHSARQVLSRGQLKLLVAALKVAQARLAQIRTDGGGEVCLLVDDLSAELDSVNRGRLLDYLYEARLQALVTGTGWDQFEGIGFGADAAMFHVEHGVVTPAKHSITP